MHIQDYQWAKEIMKPKTKLLTEQDKKIDKEIKPYTNDQGATMGTSY